MFRAARPNESRDLIAIAASTGIFAPNEAEMLLGGVLDDLHAGRLGEGHQAHVWTISEVRGAFPEGERDGDWEANRTIEIKVICEPSVADAIADAVLAKYAQDYSVVMYFSDVSVLRAERY